MSYVTSDRYGGNYPKARRLALARSGGKCQFCGLQQAVEAHHWAYPYYPSGNNVQGHDLTALCKPCHEIATVLRDWVARKDARFDDLAKDLDYCNTFIAKREAISYWLYPDEGQKSESSTYQSSYANSKKRAPGKNKNPIMSFLSWVIGFVLLLIGLAHLFNA